MCEEEPLNPADRELELGLAGLRPPAPTINRDTVLFRAGQHSQQRKLRLWQGTVCALTLVSGLSLLLRPPQPAMPQYVQVVQPVPRTVPPPGDSSAPAVLVANSPMACLALQQAVLKGGLDALPNLDPPQSHADARRDLMDLLPPGTGGSSMFIKVHRENGGRL